VTLAKNKHGEAIGFADFITVSRWDADKSFEACTACASVGLHTKLSTTTFRAILLVRYSICEDACSVHDIRRVNGGKTFTGILHPPFPERV